MLTRSERLAHRLAARPIPLNAQKLDKLARDMVRGALSRLLSASEPIGFGHLWSTTIGIRDAAGRNKKVLVVAKGEPTQLTGPSFSGKYGKNQDGNDVVIIDWPGKESIYSLQRFYKRWKSLVREVREALAHEMTHASEPVATDSEYLSWNDQQSPEFWKAYANDPKEVRATMRETADFMYQVALQVIKDLKTSDVDQVIRRVLGAVGRSPRFSQHQRWLTDDNKRLIMRGVYRELSDKLNRRKASIRIAKPQLYFLRATTDPRRDLDRGFACVGDHWFDSFEEALDWQDSQGSMFFQSPPREDPHTRKWCGDPELGLSGKAFRNITEFKQVLRKVTPEGSRLGVFSSTTYDLHTGLDGNDVFRPGEFVGWIRPERAMEDLFRILEIGKRGRIPDQWKPGT